MFRQNSERRQLWEEDGYRLAAWISSLLFLLFGSLIGGKIINDHEQNQTTQSLESQLYEACSGEEDFTQCLVDSQIIDFCEDRYDEEITCLQAFVNEGNE